MISRSFRNGEAIYRRGEAAASAFQLREGRIQLSWPEGGLEVSTILGGGQVFGAAELISGEARSATAEALGDVVVSELGRDELARLLADDPELVRTLFRPVFERLRRDERAARLEAEIVEPPAAAVPFAVSELRLKPEGRELLQQMDAHGIRITTLPFRVGRRSARPRHGDDLGGPIDLALHDIRPYSLSRRHFAIETLNEGYVVRDCGSRLGTTVNGVSIGGKLTVSIAPLVRGENRIVAGRSLSPFRFTLTIEGS